MIEALLALVIFVLALSPIIIVQSTRIRACSRIARLFDRLQQATVFMHEASMHSTHSIDEAPREKTIVYPRTSLTLTHSKPSETSSLKVFRSIVLERVKIAWRDDTTQLTDALVTCRYTPVQQQEVP